MFTGTLYAQKIELLVPNVSVYSGPYSIRLHWCAPACAECVLKFNNINKDQCVIMNYLRETFNIFGGNAPNALGCCSPDPPNQSHPCDKGVNLGLYDEEVSLKNVLKHFWQWQSSCLYNERFAIYC